jgi:type 2 lantibiotic biosynthesis protein LanM
MISPPVDPAFARGLYLTERSRRAGPATAAGRRRLGRWKKEFPMPAEIFAERLRLDDLDEDRLLAVLSDGPEAGADPPAWLSRLLEAYDLDAPAIDALVDVTRQPMASLLSACAPLLSDARRRFLADASALTSGGRPPPFDPGRLLDQLFAPLPGLMLRCLGRTLVLELQAARLTGALIGDTPERRYRAFVDGLADPRRALDLWAEYPVLGRCLAEMAARWNEAMIEATGRLYEDLPEIIRLFFDGEDPGPVTAVETGAGDMHRGGRGVMIFTFERDLKIVYKPRRLAAEALFQDLLGWLAARGAEPLRTMRLFDRGDYGWVEFIRHEPCESRAEAARFFARQGAYLCIFHALEATDFHYENLIACGEHPVPVDLETLFQPRIELPIDRAEDAAVRGMAASVLRVGLLPNRRYTTEDEPDIGGLMPVEDALTPQRLPAFAGAGTDELHLARRRLPLAKGKNLPRLGGALASVLDHEEDLVRGFDAMYRFFEAHREALWAEDGPLRRFAGAPIRVVLRPTRVYATLLRESFHPDLLRDALDRDRLFDQLWDGTDEQPWLRRAIPSELADLRAGDVPLFTGTPASRDLRGGRGELIEGALARPGIERSRERIFAFDDEDRRRQIRLIQSSLATVAMDGQHGAHARDYRFRIGAGPASRDELLSAARAAGDRLADRAIEHGGEVTWIGMALNQYKWMLAPIKNELYSGLSGVALFLAYLARVTGEARYRDLAEGAHRAMTRAVAGPAPRIAGPGLFSGWAGIVYLKTHLARLWDRPALLDEAEALAETIPALVAIDTQYDLINGTAGAVLGLVLLHRERPSARLLAMAVAAGDHLIAAASPALGGIGWPVTAAGGQTLAGFSHGAAGIAWALAHLARATGEDRFHRAAQQALIFERAVYSPAEKNWPDLRPPEGPGPADPGPRFMCAWCHGAPGIGLGRLDLPGFEGDPAVQAEIDAAIATTRARGFGHNHSLCHGDLGNLELLLLAARRRGDADLHADVYRRARGVLDGVADHGFLCGVPLSVETPGLMNGLAGIGYGLLRLADPDAVPSFLVAEPPRPAQPPRDR